MDRVRPYGARHTFFAVQGGERPFDGGRITADERDDRRASAAQTHAQNIRMSKRKGVPEDRHQRFTVWLMAPILEPFRHLRCIAALDGVQQSGKLLQVAAFAILHRSRRERAVERAPYGVVIVRKLERQIRGGDRLELRELQAIRRR